MCVCLPCVKHCYEILKGTSIKIHTRIYSYFLCLCVGLVTVNHLTIHHSVFLSPNSNMQTVNPMTSSSFRFRSKSTVQIPTLAVCIIPKLLEHQNLSVWYALVFTFLSTSHLRLFATTLLMPVSLPAFCTILVVYCISCYCRLGILPFLSSPNPTTEAPYVRQFVSENKLILAMMLYKSSKFPKISLLKLSTATPVTYRNSFSRMFCWRSITSHRFL